MQVHDIGLRLVKDESGDTGFEVLVGGGLGRTPHIGQVINPFLPTQHLLTYLAAILRVYNLEGRRDNLYKARIKILVNALGIDTFREKVEAQWQHSHNTDDTFTQSDIDALKAQFPPAPSLGTITLKNGADRNPSVGNVSQTNQSRLTSIGEADNDNRGEPRSPARPDVYQPALQSVVHS